jgi:hypothetical protein
VWETGGNAPKNRDKKRRVKTRRTSGEPVQGNTVTGDGYGRRGYKTFLRLLHEFIEVSEYGNDIFEDMIVKVMDSCKSRIGFV